MMSPLLQFAVESAVAAGRSTLGLFKNAPVIEIKADESPVTLADRHAEAMIRRAIERAYPGDGIYGEEEGRSGNRASEWVIDPIDGTKSFICGVPLYATLLAHCVDGVPDIGVCYFPALDELLYAEIGQGAFWNGRTARVSQQTDLKRSMIACGSHRVMLKKGLSNAVDRLAADVMGTRTWCDAYGHALVATGRVEAMLDPVVQPYDILAMQCIVQEAGGRFTTFEGADNPQTDAVASNAILHDAILEYLR